MQAEKKKENGSSLTSVYTLRNGTAIPYIGLGTYCMSPDEAYAACKYALSINYRHIDTASIYRNATGIAKALKESNIPRDQIWITSKLAPTEHGYKEAMEAFNKQISALGVDYLDLYLIHWPGVRGRHVNDNENLAVRKESWRALEELYAKGKVKAIGVSNYTVKHLQEMEEYAKEFPHVNQIELHPAYQTPDIVKYCEEHQVAVEAYSSLGRGELIKDEEIIKIAKKYNKTPSQILLRWALQHNFIILPKSVNENRMVENTKLFDFVIDENDMAVLDNFATNAKYCWDPSSVY